jgi:hypothetical protein
LTSYATKRIIGVKINTNKEDTMRNYQLTLGTDSRSVQYHETLDAAIEAAKALHIPSGMVAEIYGPRPIETVADSLATPLIGERTCLANDA